MTTVEVFAPAKINLTLHVIGQRADGYHELDSLVAFAPVGDELTLTEYGVSSITVDGPEAAGVPTDVENLALRAATMTLPGRKVAVTLNKILPPASGMGGGSSDAAAAVRAALLLECEGTSHFMAFGPDVLLDTRFRPIMDLGADVPMCLMPNTLRARGIGEKIDFTPLPPVAAVLINPRVAVPTPEVFKALSSRDNAPMPDTLPKFADAAALIDWLKEQRNDLEAPARKIAPVIGDVLTSLESSEGCGLARMSGSGATCFGLFAKIDDARAAAERLYAEHSDWWVRGGVLGDQLKTSMPRRRA